MNKASFIANKVGANTGSVSKVLSLFEEGNTIPFIARYRKEFTGGLDEVQIQNIALEHKRLVELIQRKETILEAIKEQEKLTTTLEKKIKDCFDVNLLEDIYAPFKRKKKTKATVAKELGLEPLAKVIMAQNVDDIH